VEAVMLVTVFCCAMAGMLMATGVGLAVKFGPRMRKVPETNLVQVAALHGLAAIITVMLVQRALVQALLYVTGSR
jgi:uncharacterized protein (DUF39 family)